MIRFISVLLLTAVLAHSQEVKSIDLTNVVQRTELRYPPDPTLNDATGFGGGYGGLMILEGAPDFRDPHELGVHIENISPHEIDPKQPFEVEFKVLNTGLASIEVPISPHLSDLQPSDESRAFEYLSIELLLSLMNADPQGPQIQSETGIELYGSEDHEGTVLTLKPGEWIRVKAKVKLHKWPLQPVSVRMNGTFLFRKITYVPHPGGSSRTINNRYPNRTPTPWSDPVDLLRWGSKEEIAPQAPESAP